MIFKTVPLAPQNLNTDDNPNLVMPEKPPPEVKGSGAEFYNVDFSLYNQRKVAGLKPSAETMPQSELVLV